MKIFHINVIRQKHNILPYLNNKTMKKKYTKQKFNKKKRKKKSGKTKSKIQNYENKTI